MAGLEIVEQSLHDLEDYASVSIAFEVRTVLELQTVDRGLGGFTLTERAVDAPCTKDYDALRGEGPMRWLKRWDISNWGILSVFDNGVRVGGCVVAFNTPGVDMLEGREDMAVLWDMRVAPDHRGTGVGSALFQGAVAWAVKRKCRLLKVETQNINVPACRFYAKQGCVLGAVNRHAYEEFPDEIQLVWYKEL